MQSRPAGTPRIRASSALTLAAGSTPAFRDIKVGVGLGIRYLTNFGPIRIDVGTPLNKGPKDSRVGVYVALGQAF